MVCNPDIAVEIADSRPTHKPVAATAGEAVESDGAPIAVEILAVTEPSPTPCKVSSDVVTEAISDIALVRSTERLSTSSFALLS